MSGRGPGTLTRPPGLPILNLRQSAPPPTVASSQPCPAPRGICAVLVRQGRGPWRAVPRGALGMQQGALNCTASTSTQAARRTHLCNPGQRGPGSTGCQTGAVGSSVCPAGFRSCLGSIIPACSPPPSSWNGSVCVAPAPPCILLAVLCFTDPQQKDRLESQMMRLGHLQLFF